MKKVFISLTIMSILSFGVTLKDGNIAVENKKYEEAITKEAVKWFEKSANQKNTLGQLNLAIMYQKGFGVEKNSKKTFEYWTKASKQGHEVAQKNLTIFCKESPLSCKKGV